MPRQRPFLSLVIEYKDHEPFSGWTSGASNDKKVRVGEILTVIDSHTKESPALS